MIDYDEDNRTFVVDTAIRHNLGSKDEIELYEELSLALELMDNDNFKVVDSNIGGGVDFGISTRYPHGLPENVGMLFFNVSTDYNVKVKETSQCVYAGERYFAVSIKKD